MHCADGADGALHDLALVIRGCAQKAQRNMHLGGWRPIHSLTLIGCHEDGFQCLLPLTDEAMDCCGNFNGNKGAHNITRVVGWSDFGGASAYRAR